MKGRAEEQKEEDPYPAGPGAPAVQHTASWSGVEGTTAPTQDAADENNTTSCDKRPTSLQLEFDELEIPVGDVGQSVAAEESQSSPALRKLGEQLAWGVGDTMLEDMPCGVIG